MFYFGCGLTAIRSQQYCSGTMIWMAEGWRVKVKGERFEVGDGGLKAQSRCRSSQTVILNELNKLNKLNKPNKRIHSNEINVLNDLNDPNDPNERNEHNKNQETAMLGIVGIIKIQDSPYLPSGSIGLI